MGVVLTDMDMTMTDSPHRSWYDGAGAGTGGGREDSDSQLSVAEHMSSLFHHHAAALEPAATRDYPGYRAATVTMTSRYYYQHQQATYAAQQGNYLLHFYPPLRRPSGSPPTLVNSF